jgi:hypothetical protein
MRAFAEHYKNLSFVQEVLAQIPPNSKPQHEAQKSLPECVW